MSEKQSYQLKHDGVLTLALRIQHKLNVPMVVDHFKLVFPSMYGSLKIVHKDCNEVVSILEDILPRDRILVSQRDFNTPELAIV